MKVLYLYQYFTTPNGAYSTRVYEFARRWVAQSVDVNVLTSVYDKSDLSSGKQVSSLEVDGIQVRIIDLAVSNKQSFALRLYSFLAYALTATYEALTTKADVIICSSGPIFVGLPGLVAKILRGRPFVFEVRDLWPEGAIQLGVVKNRLAICLARYFEKLCYRHAARIVALSPDAADWIARVSGRDDIEMIPNASDNESFDELNRGEAQRAEPEEKKVIYTGSLGAMNDPSQLVEMAAFLKESGSSVCIDVYGDGKTLKELTQECEERGLSNIKFLGSRPKTEVFQAMREAMCAVLIFHRAPVMDSVSPNKFFDALAAGLPVVQSTQGWIKKMLSDSGAGFTVDRGDHQAMGEAVMALAADSSKCRAMGERAAALARERFDRGTLANQFLKVLKDVVEPVGDATTHASGRRI